MNIGAFHLENIFLLEAMACELHLQAALEYKARRFLPGT